MSAQGGIRALVAWVMLLACVPAAAAPQCWDPPPADPVHNYESLPTHAQITEYLADDRSPSRFTCSSARLRYVGTRDLDGIRVISRYRAGNGLHAETYSSQDRDAGRLSRHGVVRVQRPDGAVQSLEYFCNGFEVGFHRYFDASGQLAAVVDYSRSDYEWRKPVDGRVYRDFYVDLGRLGSVGEEAGAQRFREVYLVHGERFERVAFAATNVFDRRWNAIDPLSTVRQWTEPGMQGTVIYHGRPARIRNYEFGYLSFAEVYQRKRLGAPGAREPQAFHPLLLQCPWIDEAMEPGLTDARLRFEPPILYAESQRAASPQQRFETCVRNPDVGCLLEQALASAHYSRPLQGREMQIFADVALAAGRPALARAAMQAVLADTKGYTLPNPFFARQSAIEAEAEAALDLDQQAQQSADAALANAMGRSTHVSGRDVPALEAIGPRLARANALERARQAFDAVPAEHAADALFTLEEIGIVQARHGDIAGARRIIEELAKIGTVAPSGLPVDRLALVEFARGQAQRGDRQAAAVTLAGIPATPADPEGVDLQAQLVFATAHCESGNSELGVATLTRARQAQTRPTPQTLADLGAAEASCGRIEAARADFRAARKAVARMPPYRGDEIGAEPERLASLHIRQRLLDAGFLDLLPDVEVDDPFAVAMALKRAELGDPSKAWSALESLHLPAVLMEEGNLALNLALARARVLGLLSRTDAAEQEFALARRVALTQNEQSTRAEFSLRLAQARLRNGQPEQARAALAEAQAAFLEALALDRASAPLRSPYSVAALARTWAAAGRDAEATRLITASRKQLRFGAIASRASDRISGEIAVSLARAGKVAESMADLQSVERSSLRVWFLARMTAIALDRKDDALLRAAAGLWRTAFDELQRTVEDANGADERRRLYHAYLVALRMQGLPGIEPQRVAALESLRRDLPLFGRDGAQVRAGCELAFTLQQLGQASAATTLFVESQEIKIKQSAVRRAEFLSNPAPAGACAHWMAAAGRAEQARSAVEQVLEARRNGFASQGSGPKAGAERTLQELAMILSESEAGEIDWLTGARLTHERVPGEYP